MSFPEQRHDKQDDHLKGAAPLKEKDTAEADERSPCGSPPEKDNDGRGAHVQELHICMGLNACKGSDVDGKAAMAGTGNCATVRHVCHGEGSCRGQGGCGYAGSEYEQFLPGAQSCRYNGSCASPLNVGRVFSAGPLKGKSVWKQARRLFEARMYEAKLAFGPSPGEGVPDDLLPGHDVVEPDKQAKRSTSSEGGGSS